MAGSVSPDPAADAEIELVRAYALTAGDFML